MRTEWLNPERYFLRTGHESVPVEEEVEVIAALEAGKRSLSLGREVMLEEVLSPL